MSAKETADAIKVTAKGLFQLTKLVVVVVTPILKNKIEEVILHKLGDNSWPLS